jgi:hypothetical protein
MKLKRSLTYVATFITLAIGIGVSVMVTAKAKADDYPNALDAAGIMAAIKVCNTPVSETMKKSLYAKMLVRMHEPSQVAYEVNEEIEAIDQLPPSDKTAMCEAIGDRAKALGN